MQPRFTLHSAPAPLRRETGVKQWSQRDAAELMDLPPPLPPPSLFMCGGIHRALMVPTERDATSLKRAQEIKSEIRSAPAELVGKQFRRGGLSQHYFYLFIYLFEMSQWCNCLFVCHFNAALARGAAGLSFARSYSRTRYRCFVEPVGE